MTDIGVTSECTNSMTEFRKDHWLSMVHAETNKKCLSNFKIIENYKTSLAGKMLSYYYDFFFKVYLIKNIVQLN